MNPSDSSPVRVLLRRADGSYCPELFIGGSPGMARLTVIDHGGRRTFLRSDERREGAIVFVEESRSGE